MRRLLALLLVLLLLGAWALGSCANDSSDDTGDTGSDTAGGSAPTVSGEFGEKPTLEVPEAEPGGELHADTLIEGEGRKVADGELVVAHYSFDIWRGTTSEAAENTYDNGVPATFALGKVLDGIDQGLVDRTIGSRVLLVIPPKLGFGDQGQPDAGIQPGDTLVFVVDILAGYAADAAADGTPTGEELGASLPEVSGRPGEKPAVTVPTDADPPTSLVKKTLIQGDGEPAKEGGLLIVQYVGVAWSTGEEFDSSWSRQQPAGFPLGQVIQGFNQGLADVPAGSRVLLVVPPALGYGEQGAPNGGIQPNETLVFVVDVLGSH